jgi:hypothetical protein
MRIEGDGGLLEQVFGARIGQAAAAGGGADVGGRGRAPAGDGGAAVGQEYRPGLAADEQAGQ